MPDFDAMKHTSWKQVLSHAPDFDAVPHTYSRAIELETSFATGARF